jgi:serine protease Do
MNTGKKILGGFAIIAISSAAGVGGGALANAHSPTVSGTDSAVTTQTTSNGSLASQTSASTIASLTSKLSPAIVDITTTSTTYSYFGGPVTQQGAGTGMIVSSNGYIVTNNHVLSLDNSPVTVQTTAGKQYTAQVVATDSTHDLALLKINATGLTTVPLGDSAKEVVGDQVMAIGNALGQFENTVTQGIISGVNRQIVASDQTSSGSNETLTGLFQTDAPINPGNSGGPLIDVATGTVIGMNTASASDGQGISFSIPISQIKSFVAPYVNGSTA